MRKTIMILPFIVMACGPSKEEIRAEKHKKSQDSLNLILNNIQKEGDRLNDSLDKLIEESNK